MELTIQKRGKNIYRKVTFILIFQFIFTIHFTVQAKNYQYRFKHLDKTDGLSHNRILCIHEDNKGFMWFGTASGLNRYDGYSFKIFKHDPNDTTTISNDFINNIWEDHKDRLWIESGNMVNIYDPLTETFSRNTGKILRDVSIPDTATISNIIKDSRGNFWFLHPAFGIYRYSTEQDTVIKIASNPNDSSALSFPNISAMAEDLQGNFWLANQHGIIEKLDSKTNKIVYRNDFLFKKYNGTNLVIKLCIDNDNDLWLVIGNYDQGVYFFNTTKNEFKHYHKDSKNLKLNINITAEIIQDNNGLIWIATDQGGINIINKKDLSVRYIMNDLEDENSLSQNTVTTLYIDDMGIIWAGTYKKGIDYYHPAIIKFKHYRKKLLDPQSLPYNDVNCYVEDKQDNVWIGTNGGGLIHFDRENDVFSQFIHNPDDPSSISTNTIVSLCLDHENKLWIGTFYGGINCYDGKRFYRYLPDPSNLNSISCYHIWSIYEDSENNLWIGTLNQGVDRFDRKKKAFYHYKGEKNNSIFQGHPVNAILEDYKGNILFGTTSGIDILDKKSGNFIQYPGNSTNAGILKNESINKIIMDKRGLLWAATQNGLMLLDQEFNLLRTFKIKDGLPDDIIISLIEDNYGNLWMGTPNGLSNLIINKKKDTDSLFFSFKNYNESDGLQGREFNQFSAIKLQSGELIFGGANGFNLFSPEEIEMNKRIPNVVFTDFQIFNKSISINDTLHGRIILNKSISQTEDIVLKYHENMFSIEFAALSYFNPDKNKYVYMLEGFNDEWLYTDAKSRKVTYTSLDPGEYIFKVKGSNNDGIWNEEGTTIRISVTPPFWQTAWFRILTVLFIITLIYIIYKIRIRNIEAHRRELEIKVKERTHELKEAYEEITDKANALEVAKKETDNILHNVEEGFFLLDKEYTISSQYSSALESIFSTQEIAHLNLIDFIRDKIPASEIENTMIYFTLLFDESIGRYRICFY
jgi:ligand-binding sensor domain-containing protein